MVNEFQMNPYFFAVTGILCLYLLIQAIRAIVETTRNYGHKVKDEPINGLYCKFCGKPQHLCGKFDSDCPHQWQEENKI
jgi:hypothetical protein